MSKNCIVDLSKLKYFDEEVQEELNKYKSKSIKPPLYKEFFDDKVRILYSIDTFIIWLLTRVLSS